VIWLVVEYELQLTWLDVTVTELVPVAPLYVEELDASGV
jgi:hypothetical protein